MKFNATPSPDEALNRATQTGKLSPEDEQALEAAGMADLVGDIKAKAERIAKGEPPWMN